MTSYQINKLDRLFQQKVCEQPSLLGGVATVGHHFTHKTAGLAMRWYLPDGIPLTKDQHDKLHGKNREEMEARIIFSKPMAWQLDLIARKNITAKNIKYQNVVDYLEGRRTDYL